MTDDMTDVRSMYGSDFIGHWDLLGKDVTVTITRIEARTLKNKGGEDAKPVIYMKGTDKGFVCNKTNTATIAEDLGYGYKVSEWVGKQITIYATTTRFGRQTVDCIRVRSKVSGSGKLEPVPDHDPETGEVTDGNAALRDKLGGG